MREENKKLEDGKKLQKEVINKNDDFDLLKEKVINKLERNPRETLKIMILVLIVSAVISIVYSVFKEPEPMKALTVGVDFEKTEVGIGTMSNGIGEIINAGSVVKESLELESKINAILAKEVMTDTDSIYLLEALDKFQQLNDKLHSKNTP